MDQTATASQLFLEGVQRLAAGDIPRAENCFVETLRLVPGRPSVLTNLSIVRALQDRLPEALELVDAAVRQEPSNPHFRLQQGAVLVKLERFADALNSLEVALGAGLPIAEIHINRGEALRGLERFEEALESHDMAIRINSRSAEAYNNRGIVLDALNRLTDAVESYDKAISLNPQLSEPHHGRGNALRKLGRYSEALDCYDMALRLKPVSAESFCSRGIVLGYLARFEEALACFDRAIDLDPALVEAHSNRGNCLMDMGRLEDASSSFKKALALQPEASSVLWNEANLILLKGDLKQGLAQFEFRDSRLKGLVGRDRSQPSPGEDIRGKRLLIWHELFLGDMIQFCRYAREAELRGAEVTLAAPAKLHALLSTMSPTIRIVTESVPDNDFDLQLPILSSPYVFENWRSGFPSTVPYLHAEAGRVETWKAKIGTHGLRVGICWQGSKLAGRSGRSFPLAHFHALSSLRDARLISLQVGDGTEQLLNMPDGMRVEELGREFDAGRQAFLDTAAAMNCMDLIITCDTSVAHLAGALGRPTWVLLKDVPDWRWFLDRRNSPWYPSMRLFRQKTRGDWTAVFEEVREALRDFSAQR